MPVTNTQNKQRTIQTNIFEHKFDNISNYALFAGGIDVTRPVLEQYDPYKTGFARIFMIRKPVFLTNLFPKKFEKFKHILEYGNTGVTGLGDITVQNSNMTGGYVGKSVVVPTIATDDTTQITISTYEFNGLPMREMLWMWVNGVMDTQTGLTHYFGQIEDGSLQKNLANETAEFIYVVTDQTGWNIQYACQLANCFPVNVPNNHFEYTAGQHDLVPLQIQFSCMKYESPQINEIAKLLLNKYQVMMNVLDFHSKYTDSMVADGLTLENSSVPAKQRYDANDGQLKRVSMGHDETAFNSTILHNRALL